MRSFIVSYKRLLPAFAALMIVLVSLIAPGQSAHAGFFDTSRGDYGSGRVLDGGVPDYVQDLGTFMSFMRSTYASAPGGNYNPPYKNQAAVAYAVRLLLGDGNSYVVTNADFDKLERLLQPENGVTINWNEWASGTVDTYSSRHYHAENSYEDSYDVNKFVHSWSNNSIVVRQSGRVVGVFQRVCFNPDGNSPGTLSDSNFDLQPTIDATEVSGEAGSQTGITAGVNNSGATQSRDASWQITSFFIPAGQAIPSGSQSSIQAPVAYYGNGAVVVQSNPSPVTFVRGNNAITANSQTLGDYPVGTRVCYALSVQPARHDDGNWRHSTPDCVVIAKKPKLQVRGNDIIVGKGSVSTIVTSISSKSISGTNRTFGSWGEYGVFATGIVKGIGSGSAFAGLGLANVTSCSATFLTFANATNTSCQSATASDYGKYVTGRSQPDIATRYPATAATATLSGTVNVATLNGVYKVSGDVVLTGGTIEKGQTVIINTYNAASGTYANVTIAGDIKYTTDPMTSGDQIPQVVLIAGNINIHGGVTQVDAWLVAKGTLNTCSDTPRASITSATCQNLLTVNGPVIANQVQLWRTAGSDTGAGSGNPAEVFNTRPDAYLWALVQTSKSGRLESVYEQSLPPRF